MYRGDFLEENKNSVTYDKNWQSVSEPEYPKLSEPEQENKESEEPPKLPKPNASKHYLLTAQLVICILISVSAFVLKSIGGETYSNIRELYYSYLDDTVIFDGESGFDINTFLGRATPDEAENK
jgi:hypothetical protein